MESVSFGITVYQESPEQLDWCLGHLRAAYPHPRAQVVVIADGTTGFYEVCRKHLAVYSEWVRLKTLENGIRWWGRLFNQLMLFDADYAFKLDADTRIHRQFEHFHSADVFGTREWNGNLQGGIQCFRRAAVRRIVESGVCDDPAYADVATWATDEGAYQYAARSGQVSTDYTLRHVCDRLGLRLGNWAEVDSQWRQLRPFREGVAATHPHKF